MEHPNGVKPRGIISADMNELLIEANAAFTEIALVQLLISSSFKVAQFSVQRVTS